MTRWVQTYHDGTPPTYADSAEECARIAVEIGADRATLRPVADADIDPEFATELALLADPRAQDRAAAEAALLDEVRTHNRLGVVAELVERIRVLVPK